MDNHPRSPRKLQKRSTSTSPYPRQSLENVSISESALSFGDTRTLSGDSEVQEHDDSDKGRSSSISQRHLLAANLDPELGGQERSHRSPLWWATEILVLFGGLLALIAIVIILWRADGKPPPQWPLNTNLNTIVAFLASLAKVTFVMAIVEGLGQLKWIWFLSSKPRPLIDFQIFEEATKGGWGSWKLLFHFKGFLASFGALILVSGLMTSTFTQMAITYPVIQAEAKSGTEVATISRATGFSVYNGNQLVPGPFEAVREQQAVYQGGFYPPNEEAPHIAPVCSSGDCVWPTYGSLAVCSDVVNLTAQGSPALLENLRNVTSKRLQILYTSIKANGDIYGWANFQAQALPGFYPVILGPMFSPSNSFNDSVKNLILNDNFVAYPTRMLDSSEPLAVDAFHFLGLTFWWCTKSYSSRVKAGEHTTAEVATRSEVKPSSPRSKNTQTLNMAWSPDFYPCYTAGTCNATFGPAAIELEPPFAPAENSPAATENYTVNVWTGLTVSGLLAATMWDSVLMDPSHGVVTSNGGGVAKAFALSVLGDFLAPAPPPPAEQLRSAGRVAANIARTITNLVRAEAGTFTAGGGDPVVAGTAYTPQAFVRVHWGWISVLSLQLGATVAFLLLTILATGRRGMQVFKSSSLATLCALRPGARQELGGMGAFEVSRARARAGRVKVRLERGEAGLVVGLDTVRRGEGSGGEKQGLARSAQDVEEVDTRRQGRVFGGYDSGYLTRMESAAGSAGSLKRLMTND